MHSIETSYGEGFLRHLDDFAVMRLEFFREFPYLYEGTFESEKEYLQLYSRDPRSMLLTLRDGGLQAISTSVPLVSPTGINKDSVEAFRSAGLNPEEYYYFGEMIIRPKFRRQGLAHKMCAMQEAQAAQWGFPNVCFATVIREENHPLRPFDYLDPVVIWRGLGFRKMDVVVEFSWPTIHADGSASNDVNRMVFWEKVSGLHKL